MIETCSAAKIASVQLDEPFLLHPENVSEGGVDKYGVQEEPTWNLQDLSDQSAGGALAPQKIQLLCKKAGSDVLAIGFEMQKLIAQWLAAIPKIRFCLPPLLFDPMLSILKTNGSINRSMNRRQRALLEQIAGLVLNWRNFVKDMTPKCAV